MKYSYNHQYIFIAYVNNSYLERKGYILEYIKRFDVNKIL